MPLPLGASTVNLFYLRFDRRATQQQRVEYAAVMRRRVGLVAVIALTLTAVTGCASSDDSVSTVASEIQDSGATSVAADCATIDDELAQWA